MSQCKECLNASPSICVYGKKINEWRWPDDFECTLEVSAFPDAVDCDFAMRLECGHAIYLQEKSV